MERRRYIECIKEAKSRCDGNGNWYLDSDVGGNMLLRSLVGLSQLKLWIEDAAAWARSEVREFDNMSKRFTIEELMMILLCYFST